MQALRLFWVFFVCKKAGAQTALLSTKQRRAVSSSPLASAFSSSPSLSTSHLVGQGVLGESGGAEKVWEDAAGGFKRDIVG